VTVLLLKTTKKEFGSKNLDFSYTSPFPKGGLRGIILAFGGIQK
jgi:hypothetical protein